MFGFQLASAWKNGKFRWEMTIVWLCDARKKWRGIYLRVLMGNFLLSPRELFELEFSKNPLKSLMKYWELDPRFRFFLLSGTSWSYPVLVVFLERIWILVSEVVPSRPLTTSTDMVWWLYSYPPTSATSHPRSPPSRCTLWGHWIASLLSFASPGAHTELLEHCGSKLTMPHSVTCSNAYPTQTGTPTPRLSQRPPPTNLVVASFIIRT